MPAAPRGSWDTLALHRITLRRRGPSLFSKKHVNRATAAVTPPGRGVGDDMAALPAHAQPSLNVLLQHRMMLVRMAPAAMNYPDTRESGAHRLQQKFIENKSRLLKIQAMQVQMRLYGKPARP